MHTSHHLYIRPLSSARFLHSYNFPSFQSLVAEHYSVKKPKRLQSKYSIYEN